MGTQIQQQREQERTTSFQVSRPNVRVAAFTGGTTVSSRRFRIEQYVEPLQRLGVELSEFIAPYGSWPPCGVLKRAVWLPATIVSRIPGVLASRMFDVTLLQREMVSTLLTLEPFTAKPRVLDMDDAIWLNGTGGSTIPKLLKCCQGVICGNAFLAEYVSRWNKNIVVLPTSVDSDRFCPPKDDRRVHRKAIIGWSGLHSGFKYLYAIERAIADVLNKRKDAILRVVSDVPPQFQALDDTKVEFIRWSPHNEVRTIQEMSIGIMPIDDSLWSRGKCSYKMLLYMSCGVPVVVSPYGMNKDVLSHGAAGLQPKNLSEWRDALLWLLEDPSRGAKMGQVGREIVEKLYSIHHIAPALGKYLSSFAQ